MKQRILALRHHGMLRNTVALYGVQIVNYALPLITVPYLAHVLGVESWGRLAFAQAFGFYLVLIVEFGFNLSATRDIARNREDHGQLAHIVASVNGAKIALVILAIAGALLVMPFIPIFTDYPAFFWAALFWAIAQGSRPLWYFEGLERLQLVAGLDIAAKTLATLSIFIFIRSPEDAWKVLGLQGLAALFSSLAAYTILYRSVRFRWPAPRHSWLQLQSASSLFIFRSATTVYGLGGTFILGLVAPAAAVGYYSAAEKIVRSLAGLFDPIIRAVYPRINFLIHSVREDAARLLRRVLVGMGIAGLLAMALLFLTAPLIVSVLLGDDFAESVGVLRILALMIPLLAVSIPLGVLWMLPLKLDRYLNYIVIATGALFVVLIVALARPYAEIGAAWALIIAEVFATLAIFAVLLYTGSSPFAMQPGATRFTGSEVWTGQEPAES